MVCALLSMSAPPYFSALCEEAQAMRFNGFSIFVLVNYTQAAEEVLTPFPQSFHSHHNAHLSTHTPWYFTAMTNKLNPRGRKILLQKRCDWQFFIAENNVRLKQANYKQTNAASFRYETCDDVRMLFLLIIRFGIFTRVHTLIHAGKIPVNRMWSSQRESRSFISKFLPQTQTSLQAKLSLLHRSSHAWTQVRLLLSRIIHRIHSYAEFTRIELKQKNTVLLAAT